MKSFGSNQKFKNKSGEREPRMHRVESKGRNPSKRDLLREAQDFIATKRAA